VTLKDVKKTVSKMIYLTDDSAVDFLFATYVAAKTRSIRPVWLMLVGPPSSGKTVLLDSIAACSGCIKISEFTPSTLLSGFVGREGQKDVLYQLNDNLLVIKDFTTILSMRTETRNAILGQLREVYDGEYERGVGTKLRGGILKWRGRVGVAAGSTEVVFTSHKTVMAKMGERFLYYRMPDEDTHTSLPLSTSVIGNEYKIEKEIHDAFRAYAKELVYSPSSIGRYWEGRIEALGEFVSLIRTPIPELESGERGRKEGGARVNKQLQTLAQIFKAVHKTDEMNEDIFKLCLKAGMDSIPSLKLELVEILRAQDITTSERALSTLELAVRLGHTSNTEFGKFLAKFLRFGILVNGRNKNSWYLGPRVQKLYETINDTSK